MQSKGKGNGSAQECSVKNVNIRSRGQSFFKVHAMPDQTVAVDFGVAFASLTEVAVMCRKIFRLTEVAVIRRRHLFTRSRGHAYFL